MRRDLDMKTNKCDIFYIGGGGICLVACCRADSLGKTVIVREKATT